ncbi:MAG: regulatory protein RecX [Eubacterium sp.]
MNDIYDMNSMYIVTDVVPAGKNKYKVYINEELAFPLYKSEIKSNNIYSGASLTKSTYNYLFNDIAYKRAKERSLYLIERMDKTKHQISTRLFEDGYCSEIIKRVLNFLERYNYINDYKYTIKYINTYSHKKSMLMIKNELMSRGIDNNIIINVLDEMCINEEQAIKYYLDRKYKNNIISDEEKQKLFNRLRRKGFQYYNIEKVLNQYCKQL